MYARMQACGTATILILALCLPVLAMENVSGENISSGKIMMVVENQLSVLEMPKREMRQFDVSKAAVYRNGLPVSAQALGSGDWVTVTAEQRDGRLVATLVEAASDHR